MTHLANIQALKVVSLWSAAPYRGTAKTMKEVGDELGVAFILTGKIRREGDLMRRTTQLLDVRTSPEAWTNHFDRGGEGKTPAAG